MIQILIPLLFALPTPTVQEDPEKLLEGHSGHGEIFNEGPRQAAYLMPNNGSVHFPISTQDEFVQAMFDQGVGQLHGFWYFEAERSFRQVAALEPDCAMAYWGMALANLDNEERAAGFAREAWLRREPLTEREQEYIAAFARFYGVDQPVEESEDLQDEEGLEQDEEQSTDSDSPGVSEETSETDSSEGSDGEPEYEPKPKKNAYRYQDLMSDLDQIIFHYPDDIEAKALLVNQSWLGNRRGLKLGSRQTNQAVLEQIFAAQPDHPAHHYRIHLWDNENTAEYAVDSATHSGPTWPTVAHMWHMGGHIFDRLHRYSDAAWQQEASARVDHAHMMRDRVLPDQIHNFAHNNEWLIRSQNHVGRVRDSIALARNMIELPRHPKWNLPETSRTSSWWGRKRLLETLEFFELWQELVEFGDSPYLEPSGDRVQDALRAFALGKAHLFLDQPEQADAHYARLGELLDEERLARVESLESAEEQAIADDEKTQEIRAAMADALKEHEGALGRIRDRIEGFELLRAALAGDAGAEQFDALEDFGGHDFLVSRLQLRAGNQERALEIAREAKIEGRAYSIANLAFVLHEAGEAEEAQECFAELREHSARFDLDTPVFERVAPLARLAGLPEDWRVEFAYPADVGERIDLDTLGPARWAPVPAANWDCPDADGQSFALADQEGKPTLLILFLGFGCVHCVEQLQAFEPVTEEFREAGIDIVTIGNQSVEDLNEAGVEDYPFPILSDPEHEVFHAYRCYDDFEDMPLHGTFLIDGQGRVRWQDVSYEPFTDTEFMLAEARRLLKLPVDVEMAKLNSTGSPASRGGR